VEGGNGVRDPVRRARGESDIDPQPRGESGVNNKELVTISV
jgi:hypothetical protein